MRTFSLIIFIFLSISLFAKTETAVIYNANGTQTIRIPLNHESQNITQVNLRGAQAEKAFSLPIASRWIVLSAKLKLYYTSSITIIPERSSISVSFNNKTLTQKWINALDRGLNTNLETSLPAEDFENFNQITINSYQHYTIEHCEDETAPELWTKIDSKKSYVELVVLPKTLPNALSSIDHFLFDFKNISRQNIVFVLPPKRNKDIATGAVITASSIGKKLKYRDIALSVSSAIPNNSDSIIIAPRNELIALLKTSFGSGSDQITQQINKNSILFFNNPFDPQYSIVCITGDTSNELLRSAQAFASYDFTLYKGNGVKVNTLTLPDKSTPYSAPNHLPLSQPITFRELGQKTTTFKYMYPAPIDINFKMYPDLYFNEKQNITIGINGVFPVKVRHDSILNIGVNDKFAAQLPFTDKIAKEVSMSKFFNFKESDSFPAYLIGKGKNKLSLQPAMIPFKKGFCELYNMENLQTTILDTSFIQLPDAPHWIEMPYVRYFLYAAYPFSIHPDGLKTAILLDTFSSVNLQAALKIGFFLGREIEYPLYRITVTTTMDEVEDKEIIYIGSYDNSKKLLFENAQVKVNDDHFSTSFPMIYKFIDYLPFFDSERLQPFRYNKFIEESSNADKNVLLQVFRSPFDRSHSVISFQYDSAESIKKGIDLIFSPEQEIGWESDTLILDTELEKITSFQIAEKYFLGNLNIFDQIRFYVTQSPLGFAVAVLFFALLLAYVIRRLLLQFKEKNHPHV